MNLSAQRFRSRALKTSGFTLLEVIVALVLIATTGMALLSWINTNLISLQRVQAAQERQDAVRNALAFLDTINPETQPSGETEVGIYHISWVSTALQPAILGVNKWGDEALYNVGLYQTACEVQRDSQLVARFSVRLVGYKQVKFLPDFF